LTDRGLADALRAVAAQAPIPVHVSAAGVRRHPIEIESAVYFTCVEALQNTLKHAGDVTGVRIELSERPGTLHFEVRDDGRGFTTGEGSRPAITTAADCGTRMTESRRSAASSPWTRSVATARA
jgi:signal transduction histidine kinase